MNLTLILALIAGAFFSEQAGLTFVAVLLVLLAALLLFSGAGASSSENKHAHVNISEPYGPEGPIVVENKVPDVPYPLFLKLKHDWQDFRQFEYSFFNFGSAMHNVGHFFYQLITGHHKKKDDNGH